MSKPFAALMVATLVAIGVYAPNFFRYHNVINVLLQASLLGLLAIGMTVVRGRFLNAATATELPNTSCIQRSSEGCGVIVSPVSRSRRSWLSRGRHISR